MSVLKLNRQQKSVVVFWVGPPNMWRAPTKPRMTSAYRDVLKDNAMVPADRIRELADELSGNGYQTEIVNQQTAETFDRWWDRELAFA